MGIVDCKRRKKLNSIDSIIHPSAAVSPSVMYQIQVQDFERRACLGDEHAKPFIQVVTALFSYIYYTIQFVHACYRVIRPQAYYSQIRTYVRTYVHTRAGRC
jgi:hypothetical protein